MKYSVDIDVHGTVHLDVEAKDAKEAYRRIEEKMRLKTIYSQGFVVHDERLDKVVVNGRNVTARFLHDAING